MKTNTLIIIGKSPIIDLYENEINLLIDRYDTMSINSVATKYHTKYCTFLDTSIKYYVHHIPEDVTCITTPINVGYCSKHPTEVYKSFKYKEGKVYTDNSLAYFGFTHDYAICWGIKNNYKNIVLIGAADFDTDKYCSSIKFSMPKFNINKGIEKASIDGISQILKYMTHLYTVNPLSKLDIDRTSISDLLYNSNHTF